MFDKKTKTCFAGLEAIASLSIRDNKRKQISPDFRCDSNLIYVPYGIELRLISGLSNLKPPYSANISCPKSRLPGGRGERSLAITATKDSHQTYVDSVDRPVWVGIKTGNSTESCCSVKADLEEQVQSQQYDDMILCTACATSLKLPSGGKVVSNPHYRQVTKPI